MAREGQGERRIMKIVQLTVRLNFDVEVNGENNDDTKINQDVREKIEKIVGDIKLDEGTYLDYEVVGQTVKDSCEVQKYIYGENTCGEEPFAVCWQKEKPNVRFLICEGHYNYFNKLVGYTCQKISKEEGD